jgi:murein DD-endopeptidase MepM/ murein hydrolase activator NlpD
MFRQWGKKTEKISLLIVSHNGQRAYNLKFSKRLGVTFLWVMLVIIISAGVGVYKIFQNESLKRELRLLKTELFHLELFARRVEENLKKLEEEQNKLKTLAGVQIEKTSLTSFGKGGGKLSQMDNLVNLYTRLENYLKDIPQLKKYFLTKREELARIPAIWPVKGFITSPFGPRLSPFTGKREFHKGVDIVAREESKIVAAADGRVRRVGYNRAGLGHYVEIDHQNGYITLYGHNKITLVKPRQRVKRGDVIALLGRSGRTTGPHLHYQITLNGKAVNPYYYLLD